MIANILSRKGTNGLNSGGIHIARSKLQKPRKGSIQ
jgi:hypothetical protein